MKKLLRISPVIVIMNLSVLLLVYFGYGEAKRAYWKFKLDKLITQSHIVRDLMDDFLEIGLPLSLIKDFLEKESSLGKFAGFSVFFDDDDYQGKNDLTIRVLNNNGDIIFSNQLEENEDDNPNIIWFNETNNAFHHFDYRHTVIRNKQYWVSETETHYLVILPLRDKFSQVGNLFVSLSKKPVQLFLKSKFIGVVYATAGICLLLVLLIVIIDRLRVTRRYKAYLGIGYGLSSLIMASIIVTTLISIYSHGAEDKIRMLSKSLTNRLSAIVESGVTFETVSGLEAMLCDYQRLDSDIDTVALSDNGMVIIHQNSAMIGQPWQVPTGQNDYTYAIKNSRASVIVTMDRSIIRYKVLLAVKNLATLIAACCFIGFLTYNIGATLRNLPICNGPTGRILNKRQPSSQGLYETMMPVWFLMVFAESLNLSFLPQYLQNICAMHQISQFSSSILFSTFFIGFALILVPSGYLSDRWGDNSLIMLGILSFAATMGLMGVTQNYLSIMVIRFLAGAAQGVVFIGVQNYIRKASQQGKMSQGGAVIVFSFNGGIISGSAIGSILLADIGVQGIFFSAAVIAIAAFGFTLLYVPGQLVPEAKANRLVKATKTKTFLSIGRTLIKDGEFIRTLFLVGATSKVTFTGITIYAVPLLMNQKAYTQEDVGLAIMLYACAVLVSNGYISKWVDKFGNIPFALFGGVLISSLGITAIGLVEWERMSAWSEYSVTLLFFGGMLLIGVANGAISSPVVSHIMETQTCRALGQGAGVGAYRLFERMGHVAGPIIIGQLFVWCGQWMNTILLLGIIVAVFGIIFFIATGRKQRVENHMRRITAS